MEEIKTFQDLMAAAIIKQPEQRLRPVYDPTDSDMLQAGNRMIDSKYLPYDQKTFRQLAVWLARFAANAKHGLLLAGNVGTGKTYFFQSVLNIRTFIKSGRFVDVYKERGGICDNGFWYDTLDIYESETWTRNIIVDDLGQEPTCNYYGAVTEVLDEVLNRRYLDWQKKRALTLITTNLSMSQLDKRYGRRTYDRLREMCDLIEFRGESVRGI